MINGKHIISAQKLLRKLESEPVKVINEQGIVSWQVTYSNSSYVELLKIVEAVANTPMGDYDNSSYTQPEVKQFISTTDYHRDKI